jgi:hypothetical protein
MHCFAVELEYLVPVWTTVVVEADDDNHVKAAADDADCWDHAETDYDSCTRIELVGCRKLPKAMARTIAAMAPGYALATKQMHDFIHAQLHRKQPRAVARFRTKRTEQTLLTKERPA